MTPQQRKDLLDEIKKKFDSVSWAVHQLETNGESIPDTSLKIIKARDEMVVMLETLVNHLPKPAKSTE
jgi:hypothetical protein